MSLSGIMWINIVKSARRRRRIHETKEKNGTDQSRSLDKEISKK